MELETVEACLVCGSDDLTDADPDHRLKRCVLCSFVFDSPRPTSQEITKFYSQATQYDSWIDEREVRDRLWTRRLRKLLQHRRGGSLLDVGAGIGQFLNQASQHFDHVCGTEISASAVAVASERYGLELFHGELEQFHVGRHFDNITLFHVLEHVPDPHGTLTRCWELLAPGGVIFIAVPNDLEAVRQRVKVLLGKFGIARFSAKGRLALPRISLDGSLSEIHLSHFTVTSLERLLKEGGYSVLDSSLDPYSVATGGARLREGLFRAMCEVVRRVTGRNVYDTIWMVAQKSPSSTP